MQTLESKVAVVTGAASGIGRALAMRFANERMKVVLADIDAPALDTTVGELRGRGFDVTGVETDVTRLDSVQALAQKAVETYGKVHVLCNNAGVLGPLTVPIWETTSHDWDWMMGVNFRSVLHGLWTFVPTMLAQNEEAHVVNTASSAGISAASSIYGVTKHAVVAVSETLYFQLKQMESKIGVTCLCPGVLSTNLPANNTRVRPAELQNVTPTSDAELERQRGFAANLAAAKPPGLAAERVIESIRSGQFWVTTDSEWDERFRVRWDGILIRTNPVLATR